MASDTNENVNQRPVSIKEARKQLGGISNSHIYNLINGGKIYRIKIGGRSFIPLPEIERIQREGA